MEFIIGYLLFSLVTYFSFFLPGKLVLSRVFPDLQKHALLLSWPVGISLFLLGSYVSAWIQMPYAYLFCLGGVLIFALLRNPRLFIISIKNEDFWSWGIVILGSLVFLSLTAFSYIHNRSGIQFIGTINVMDGLLHMGYAKNLLLMFPPTHAGLAGIPLRGYHYFYDLLISRMVLFYHFAPEDLYYRYFPLMISLLYGGGFWLVVKSLTTNKLAYRMVLFFAYFAQSFAYVLSFFVHGMSPIDELGSIYPLELILNPAIILSIGLLLCAVFVLFESKPKVIQMVTVGLLFGVLIELKVYTGIIGISVLAFVCLYRILKERKKIWIYISCLVSAGLVIAVTYIPNNLGAGSLWFSPFFPYSVYMQEPPFLQWQWELKRRIFSNHHNIPHLILLYSQAIGLFWLLSLGSRIIVVLGLPALLSKSFWKNERNLAVALAIVVPIAVGSLFVQSVSIFDTKQFFWIAGALIALPAGVVVGKLLANRNNFLKIGIIGVIVWLSWGGEVGQLHRFLLHEGDFVISKKDEMLLRTVGGVVPKDQFILYINDGDQKVSLTQYPFSNSPVISALTGRPTYYEPESAQFAIGDIYTYRQKKLTQLSVALRGLCKTSGIQPIIKSIGTPYVVTTHPNTCLRAWSKISLTSSSGLSFYQLNL